MKVIKELEDKIIHLENNYNRFDNDQYNKKLIELNNVLDKNTYETEIKLKN